MSTRITTRLAAFLAALACAAGLNAGSLSLSPAVVTLAGDFGQSTTQTLTIRNETALELTFDLVAKDVSVRGGRRVFLDPGELADGIAATAVFSERSISVPAGQKQSVEVTLTLPRATRQRAVVAIFRGTTPIRNDATSATASLGTLLTFTLSDGVSIFASDLTAKAQSATGNTAFVQSFTNDGQEPVLVKGVTVVLDGRGTLVGKVPFEARRLLPDEDVILRGEFPGELASGRYRALSTVEAAGRAITRSAGFVVP
jgi:hypothetical protein